MVTRDQVPEDHFNSHVLSYSCLDILVEPHALNFLPVRSVLSILGEFLVSELLDFFREVQREDGLFWLDAPVVTTMRNDLG